MDEVVVVAAAVFRDGRLFVARRRHPPSVAGLWELPGNEVPRGADERDTLEREFLEEFTVPLRCVDRLLSDRRLTTWRNEEGHLIEAVLRLWRCQLPREIRVDVHANEPRPNMREYEESRWLVPGDLDAVTPWRDADRIAADEVVRQYVLDELWRSSD